MRFVCIWSAVCLVLCFFSSEQLRAQPSPRETVIVTAHSSPVAFEELGRGVTIIEREQIRLLPVESVADLLRYVASVDVHRRSPFGVQTDFSARGAGFSRTLVLINGVRINDSQSAHHNGDLPVTLAQLERVEVMHGTGSSVYGSDAFGATINLVTRKGGSDTIRVSAGQHGLVEGDFRTAFEAGPLEQVVAVSGNRSSGFMFDRDFQTLSLSSQTDFGSESRIYFGHVRKAFGADQFYGPSPSKEWTNSTLASFERGVFQSASTEIDTQFFYRTHGDRFLWDIRRPGEFENRHRTHAVGGRFKSRHQLSEERELTWGFEAGHDWIASSNIGDHSFGRWAAFVEVQQQVAGRLSLIPGLRFDQYAGFGSSLSPSASAGWWVAPQLKLRASAGHAFRVPTFTELFYSDPQHAASADLGAEEAVEYEAGLDWIADSSWLVQVSLFSRWDQNVIDWVRESPRQKWRTTNIRDLRTRGAELGLQKALGDIGMAQAQYAYLDSTTDSLDYFSKYVLDFARHSFSGFGTLNLPGRFRLGQDVQYRVRSDGRSYWVVNQKWLRDLGEFSLMLEISNLLNADYEEIRNIRMPGRWIRFGVELSGFQLFH